MTGANLRNADAKTSETVNQAAISGMRDPKTPASATLQEDLQKLTENLKPFVDAQKGESGEELAKWKRDKFDAQFAKYIHKYFLNQKAKGRATLLEESAFKDLHFMTNKYLELLGSVEFNTYMQSVLTTKLSL